MHQFQQLGLWAGLAQLLNHAKTHPRAAMHRHPGRFVDRHQTVVFQKHRKFTPRRWALGFFGDFFRNTHGRQTHLVAVFNPGLGRSTAFVDAHFAAADDAVDVGFGHTLQMTHQKVVQSLTGRLFVHQQPFDGGRRSGRLGPYNVIHWQLAVSG